jgi:hypothetical protein
MLLPVVLSTLRCVSWPDDVMGGGSSLPRPDTGLHDDAGGVIPNPKPDAGPREAGPSDCPAQVVTWQGDGGSTCEVALEAGVAAGDSIALNDPVVPDTGNATAVCGNGTFTLSSTICEPPRRFDVSGPTGCVRGYCEAVVGGQCGVPDPKKAKAICVFEGYADEVGYDTLNGVPNSTQCLAGGTSCYTSLATCNIMFTMVQCRH